MRVKTVRFLSIAATCVVAGALVGCSGSGSPGANVSAAWQAGYDAQASISAKPQHSYAEAYAYCQTLQAYEFVTSDQTEADDYVAGCIAYVFDGSSNTSSNSNAVAPVAPVAPAPNDLLSQLNDAGDTSWSEDKVANLSGIPSNVDYLGTSGDGATCAVWVFDDEATATDEAEGGAFDWVTGYYWYGSDDFGDGIVLIADSAYDGCARDAANALNWNLE